MADKVKAVDAKFAIDRLESSIESITIKYGNGGSQTVYPGSADMTLLLPAINRMNTKTIEDYIDSIPT